VSHLLWWLIIVLCDAEGDCSAEEHCREGDQAERSDDDIRLTSAMEFPPNGPSVEGDWRCAAWTTWSAMSLSEGDSLEPWQPAPFDGSTESRVQLGTPRRMQIKPPAGKHGIADRDRTRRVRIDTTCAASQCQDATPEFPAPCKGQMRTTATHATPVTRRLCV
jgi:hypothetical protein